MSGSEGSDVDAALKLKTAALAISTAKKLFKKGYRKVTAVNRFKKGPTHGIDLSTKEALESAVTKPLYPIYVLPVENLHQLEQLTHHEELLKQGLLRRLIPDQKGYFKIHEARTDGSAGDDVSAYYPNQYTDNVLVFSHRWLRPNEEPAHPDSEDNKKLYAIKHIVENAKEIWTDMQDYEAPLYIWMDYLCVPQRDRDTQKKAILSIPAYFNQSCKFISLSQDEEAFEKYMSRSWCRLEVISSRSPKPFLEQWYVPAQQHVFFMGDKTTMPLSWDHFKNPVEGDVTDERDKEYIAQLMTHYVEELKRFKSLDEESVYFQHGETEFLKPGDIPQEVIEKLLDFA